MACPHISEPRACWNVRCQLGGSCIDPNRATPHESCKLKAPMPDLRDEFEAWAKERGHPLCDVIPKYGPASSMNDTTLRFSDIAWEAYQAATERAAKKEREECANVCDDQAAFHQEMHNSQAEQAADGCAAAIRAREGKGGAG